MATNCSIQTGNPEREDFASVFFMAGNFLSGKAERDQSLRGGVDAQATTSLGSFHSVIEDTAASSRFLVS